MRQWIAETCFGLAEALAPILGYTLLIGIVVIVPLIAIRKTRAVGGGLLVAISYIFGAVVVLFSAGVTFTLWGWVGLIIGFFMAGVGVVPMAILAGFLEGYTLLSLTTIVLVVIVFFLRTLGISIATRNID